MGGGQLGGSGESLGAAGRAAAFDAAASALLNDMSTRGPSCGERSMSLRSGTSQMGARLIPTRSCSSCGHHPHWAAAVPTAAMRSEGSSSQLRASKHQVAVSAASSANSASRAATRLTRVRGRSHLETYSSHSPPSLSSAIRVASTVSSTHSARRPCPSGGTPEAQPLQTQASPLRPHGPPKSLPFLAQSLQFDSRLTRPPPFELQLTRALPSHTQLTRSVRFTRSTAVPFTAVPFTAVTLTAVPFTAVPFTAVQCAQRSHSQRSHSQRSNSHSGSIRTAAAPGRRRET